MMEGSYYQQILQKTGCQPELLFLTSHQLDSLEGYQEIIQRWQEILGNSSHCIIYINQHPRFFVERYIPEPIMIGLALAIYVAKLPIIILKLNEGSVDVEKVTSDYLVAADKEVNLMDYYEDLTNLTLVLRQDDEDLVYTKLNILSWYGFLTAFDLVKQYQVSDFFKAAYITKDEEIVCVDLS